MNKLMKRILAIVCAVAVVLTGLSVEGLWSRVAEAADVTTTGTLTINTAYFNSVLGWNADGSFNIPGCSASFNSGSGYGSDGGNFLSDDFVDNYVEFDGGMTKADFMHGLGLITYYHNVNCTLQINWSGRTEAFTPGWSFSIAQGAPIAYKLSNGTMAYLALDKEYVFTFAEGHSGYRNVVNVKGYKTTTFSLKTDIFGTGSSETGADKIISFADKNVKDYVAKYHYMHDDSEYASYINFNGVAFEDLAATGLKLRYGLENGEFIQIENWGTFAGPNGMKAGDQFVFKKGLPIYYVVNGVNYKATLDATYIYECTGPNSDNHQVFLGCKVDDVKTEFGLNTIEGTNGTFVQNRGYTEWATNLMMDKSIAGGSCGDILAKPYSREFVEFKGITYEQAKNRNILMSLHGSAPCIQLGFRGDLADSDLPVGTQIILKKGFPITWNTGAIQCAVLNDSYVITLEGKTAGSSGNYQWSVRLYDTYRLTTAISGPATEGIGYYYALPVETSTFSDIQKTSEMVMSPTIWTQYLTLSNHPNLGEHTDATPGEKRDIIFICYTYDPAVYRGLRIYCNKNTELFASLQNGEIMMLKEGLPITYTTTTGKLKNIYLDKDYGFVYNASTKSFTYDSSLVWEESSPATESFGFNTEQVTTHLEGVNQVFNTMITGNPFTFESYLDKPLYTDENAKTYIDYSACEQADVVSANTAIHFIVASGDTQVIQTRFGANAVAALQVGDRIVLKKGMPVAYSPSNTSLVATLDNDYALRVIANNGTNVTMQIELTGTYSLSTDEFYHQSSYMDVKFASTNLFSDAPVIDGMNLDASVMQNYLEISGQTYENLANKGYNMQFFVCPALSGIRINYSNFDLEAYDVVLFKEGLPFTYTTTGGKTKTVFLDKTYGYSKNAATAFLYDATITEIKPSVYYDFGLNGEFTSFEEEGMQKVNMFITGEAIPVPSQEYNINIFANANTRPYITVANYTEQQLMNAGFEVYYIPHVGVCQMRLGNLTLENGDIITFNKDLKISYYDNGKHTATLDDTYSYKVTKNTDGSYTLRRVIPGEEVEHKYIGLADLADVFDESGIDKVNLPFVQGAIELSGYIQRDILIDTSVLPYITVQGNGKTYTPKQLSDYGFKIMFIPTAGVFQVVMGNLPWEEGIEIHFAEGMEVVYYDGGEKVVILDDTYKYELDKLGDVSVLKRIVEYDVTITVDGTEVIDGSYREGTQFDLSGYKNEKNGKVMSIRVNGEVLAGTTFVATVDSKVVIENRADLCKVVFMDEGEVCTVREYEIDAKNIKLPYAPDKDGYDDTWEKFTLVNDTIYVNAIHTAKQTHPIVKLSGVVLEETSSASGNDSNNNSVKSPGTGDDANGGGWLFAGALAMAVVVLGFTNKKRKCNM